DVDPVDRSRLVAAEVGALIAWLGLAVVGHAHKIVPFIGYARLRAQGVTSGGAGGRLLFGDLYHHGAARATLVGGAAGFATALAGLLLGSATVLAVGGATLSATGALVTLNLATGPRRVVRRAATTAPAPAHPQPVGPHPLRRTACPPPP